MKTLALTPWQIWPPTSGGQERCYNLLSRIGPVTVMALDWAGEEHHLEIGDMDYWVVPADEKAREQAVKLNDAGIQTFDPMPMLCRKNLNTIRQRIDMFNPDIIILEHPWLLDLIEDRPYIYDSHNCETISTRQQRPYTLDMNLVADIERRATQGAEHMTYTSKEDLKQMKLLYPFDTPSTLIPNGVTLPEHVATGDELNLIFIGSLYGPNIQAAQMLISLAPQLKQYKIRILGNVCAVLENKHDNVELIGPVNDKQLDYYFRTAYAFINLTNIGTGTHLKVGRALAYGLPVISTPIGGRGYVTPLHTIPAYVPDMLEQVRKKWQHFHQLSLAEASTLTWDKIGADFKQVVDAFQ